MVAIIAASLIAFWPGLTAIAVALLMMHPVGLAAILPLGGRVDAAIGASPRRALRPMAPPLAVGIVFAARLILLTSGSLPADQGRLGALRAFVPLGFFDAWRLVASPAKGVGWTARHCSAWAARGWPAWSAFWRQRCGSGCSPAAMWIAARSFGGNSHAMAWRRATGPSRVFGGRRGAGCGGGRFVPAGALAVAGGAADPGRGARYDRPKPDADAGRSLIAKGAPIGDPASGRDLIRTLREKADRGGKRRAFHGAPPACLPVFLDLGLPIPKMAEVGRVDLTRRAFDGPWRKDFRHARGRAAREGHAFEIARACDPAPAAPKLRAISDAWLASKHGAEKGFSLGAAPFSGLDDRPLAPQWTRIGGFVHDHGDRFCNVEGLRGFREKLDPVRTLNHLAGPGGMAAPRVRHEVNLLVSGGVRGLAA